MSDDTTNDCDRRMDRRTVLKCAGVAGTGVFGLGSAGQLAEASTSLADITVNLYYSHEVDKPDEHMSNAKEALDQMENQLNTSVTYWDLGQDSGDYSNADTYDEYQEEFRSSNYLYSGEAHVLLYYQPASTGQALAGKAVGSYRSGNTPTCVVNTETRNSHSVRAFKNTVMHELGHLMLDDDNAPDTGNEHSFGAQYNRWYGRENSPMLTWYSGNHNPAPALCCNRSDINTTELLNGQFSDCTVSEIERWLNEEY